MNIPIVTESITESELTTLAQETYEDMLKGVCDIKREIIAFGGMMHADAEAALLENGSQQEDIWGFNVYLKQPIEDHLEYTSFINIRPRDGNRSQEIMIPEVKEKIKQIVIKRVRYTT